MAAKTRSITQYNVLTLIRVVRESKNNTGSDIARRELVAIFDDSAKLKAFVEAESAIEEHDVLDEWVSLKPAASNFSLPFNPKAGEVEFTSKKAAKRK